MSMHNGGQYGQCPMDGEFRYIVQWFHEWSELQRDDFVPVLVEYITQESDASASKVCMNGVVNSVALAGLSDRPMSLFQCRIKLFREWSPKWPQDFKHKLKEKIIEIDTKVGEKIINEIKGPNGQQHESVAEAAADAAVSEVVSAAEMSAAAIVESSEVAAIDADNRLAAVLNNETPVDDVEEEKPDGNDNDNDNAAAKTVTVAAADDDDEMHAPKPAEPVPVQMQEHAAAVTTAEVPPVA